MPTGHNVVLFRNGKSINEDNAASVFTTTSRQAEPAKLIRLQRLTAPFAHPAFEESPDPLAITSWNAGSTYDQVMALESEQGAGARRHTSFHQSKR
jgi:hypothetical protein